MSLTDASGLLTAGASVVPGGTLVTGVLTDLFGGIGSKYTKSTFVQRFTQAASGGDDRTAGALIDQAVYHGWIQGVADASTWQGLLAAIYQAAPPKWQTYVQSRLTGAPALYDFVGSKVANPVNLGGVAPITRPPAGTTLGEKVLDFFGIGSAQQTNLALQAGQQAGAQIGKQLVAVLIGAVVVVLVIVLVLKLRRR